MVTISAADGGFKVAWRRKLPAGGYTNRSKWMKDEEQAEKLAEMIKANNGMVPSPMALNGAGLIKHAELVDPLLVVQISEILNVAEWDASYKLMELRDLLASFEALFDNSDGQHGVLK